MKKACFIFIFILFSFISLGACSDEPNHVHNFNQKVVSEEYLSSQATCTLRAKYYYSCECKEKSSLTFEYGYLLDHDYTKIKSNSTEHWYECECGDISDVQLHKGGQASCVNLATCEICQKEYGSLEKHFYNILNGNDTAHWYECECANKESIEAHRGGIKTCSTLAKCEICQKEYGSFKEHNYAYLKFNERTHWNECACGDKNNIEAHKGGVATCTTRAICTICSEEYGDLKEHSYATIINNDTEHWYECICGDKKDVENHKGGTPTCTTLAKCDICQKEYGNVKEHLYLALKSNETYHWYECECGDKTSVENHEYNDGEIILTATCIEDGTKEFTCIKNDCNYSYIDTYSMHKYSATEIYDLAVKYTGEIIVYDKFGKSFALGTGFVYTSDGKIITNYHVIDGAYFAEITINNNTYSITKVLAYNEKIDLAVLQIDATGLDCANICKNPVKTGETIYAIGSSRGLTNTHSQGIITHANRVVDNVVYVQHDASITNGNSGGPIVNVYGEVIGINTWGILDSQNLNFAIFTSELDNLMYGSPITLQELYNLNNNPTDILFDWLLANYNYSDNKQIRFDEINDSNCYSIGYNLDYNYLYIDVLWVFEDESQLYISISFLTNPTKYPYYANYNKDGNENFANGRIDATTFTENTELTCLTYDGDYWDKNSLMKLYQFAIVDLIDWFDWSTIYYNIGISIADIGFNEFEVDDDTNAIDYLIDHVVEFGVFDVASQWYEIEDSYTYSEYIYSFSLVYSAKYDIIFVSMRWLDLDGKYFYTYLRLTPSSKGIYYSAAYELYQNDVGFLALNDTSGYIDPAVFTSSSTLTYTSYDGLENNKAELLEIYTENISEILTWLNNYMQNNNLDITIKDLGFISF